MFAHDSLALGRTRPVSDWAVTAKNPENAQFNRGCLTFGEVTTYPSALFEASRAQEGRAGHRGGRSSPSISSAAAGCRSYLQDLRVTRPRQADTVEGKKNGVPRAYQRGGGGGGLSS